MKKICLLALLTVTNTLAYAGATVIYGKDNRQDVYATKNPVHIALAKSTAGMIHLAMFQKAVAPQKFDLRGSETLQAGANVCSTERFAKQHLAPTCSGFLVGPDLLVTAGHCYLMETTAEEACKSFAWVFDYEMKSENHNPTKNISRENIYLCKNVIASELSDTMDFAIVQLERKVVGRAPLQFRETGKVETNSPLMVIGHPTGLPTKISDGGRIIYNEDATRILTTLDTFQGNSGSGVFNSRTGVLEGILIQGKTDYMPSKPSEPDSCQVVNKCDDNGMNCAFVEEEGMTAPGEIVLRISKIAPLIKKALSATR